MIKVLAVAALLAFLFSGMSLWDAVTRKPLTISHGQELAKRQVIYTVALVVCALILGLALENILP